MSKKLVNLVELTKSLKKQLQEDGQAALKEAFDDFFSKHPEATSIVWTQYTPYFNDGDTCYFGIHDWELKVDPDFMADDTKETWYADHEDEDDNEYHYGEADYTYYLKKVSGDSWNKPKNPRELTKEEASLLKDFNELESSCQDIEDVMQTVLGDHVKVVATKDGFDIDEWSHD